MGIPSRGRALRSAPVGGLLCLVVGAACHRTSVPAPPAAIVRAPVTLKTAFRDDFLIGGALNAAQFGNTDTVGAALAAAQFSTISPENVLKWERVHPAPDRYDFAPADAYIEFGERHGMVVIGHTLVWHSQTPRWVFEDGGGRPASRDTLLARMREHIHAVVGRYKGRIKGWDVVNEALDEDGTLRKSPWRTIIGDDFIAKAFEYAHEADSAAELYYNDYSLENPAKRAGAVALIRGLQARGIPITAVGIQGHMKMDWPTIGLEDSTIAMFAATGVKVNISELDVDVLPANDANRSADVQRRVAGGARLNPYAGGLPDSIARKLATRYAGLFAVYLKHRDVIDRVTFWGVADGDSWLNNWPVRGRTSYPLVFDRKHQPKAAFDSIVARALAPRPRTVP